MIKHINDKKKTEIVDKINEIIKPINGMVISMNGPLVFGDFSGGIPSNKILVYGVKFYIEKVGKFNLYLKLTNYSNINKAIAEGFSYFQLYNRKFSDVLMFKIIKKVYLKK